MEHVVSAPAFSVSLLGVAGSLDGARSEANHEPCSASCDGGGRLLVRASRHRQLYDKNQQHLEVVASEPDKGQTLGRQSARRSVHYGTGEVSGFLRGTRDLHVEALEWLPRAGSKLAPALWLRPRVGLDGRASFWAGALSSQFLQTDWIGPLDAEALGEAAH